MSEQEFKKMEDEISELEEALAPFAAFAQAMWESYRDHPDEHVFYRFETLAGPRTLRVGDFRRARKVLTGSE